MICKERNRKAYMKKCSTTFLALVHDYFTGVVSYHYLLATFLIRQFIIIRDYICCLNRTCVTDAAHSDRAFLLLIQCESGDRCGSLIACARYIILDEIAQNVRQRPIIHIVLLVQLSLTGRGIFFGFQVHIFFSKHIH